MVRTLPLLLLALGCRPTFTSVDEACDGRVRGYSDLSDDVSQMNMRWNCYRRLAKMSPVRFHRKFQAAMEAHGDFLALNPEYADSLIWFLEDPSLEGYTGVDPFTRLDYQSYPEIDVTSIGLWFAFLTSSGGSEEVIDAWVDMPYTREAILQPGAIHGGVTRSAIPEREEDVFLLDLLFDWPPSERSGRPIVYPVDGQRGVPPNFESYIPGDPIIGLGTGGAVGYPISVTVSAEVVTTGWNSPDPFEVRFTRQELSGPGGEVVPTEIMLPGFLEGVFPQYSVYAVPLAPLEENTTYTFSAGVEWIGGKKDIDVSFTTGTTRDYSPFLVRSSQGPVPATQWSSGSLPVGVTRR